MPRQVTTLPITEKTVAAGNWDSTRATVDRIVLHTMVGTVAGADARFNNSASGVSAHYGVGTDGKIVHWVDEDNTAYHAGNYAMNQRSIGIEHEDKWTGPPAPEPTRPDALYAASAKLVADICKFYNIPCDNTRVIKHKQVINTACPDGLDTERIIREANTILNPTPVPTPPATNLTEYMIRDTYQGLLGVQPTTDEIKYRQNQNLPLRELINDICMNDARFKTKWVKPAVQAFKDKAITQLQQQSV